MGERKKKNSYTVSVIVNNSSDSRWTSLREGAEAAARDYNIRLNYVATGEFWGKQNELEIIYKELESGVDGMIIQMYASEGVYEGIEDRLPREKCVLLETDITPEEYYQTVGPDNKELGSVLAERICQDFGENLTGKDNRYSLWKHWSDRSETTTGWVGGDASGKREQKIQWKLAEMGRNPDKKLFEEKWNLGADIVIALENSETERAVDYMQENQISVNNCVLYGWVTQKRSSMSLIKGEFRHCWFQMNFTWGIRA